jgi:ATP-binding cassette, subfamily F, member 3
MSSEEDLVSMLSGVLLQDDQAVDGLDEDLVQYIAGLLSTQLQEGSDIEEILEESMVPFLDSVGCPSDLVEQVKTVILEHHSNLDAPDPSSSDGLGAKKLRQGIVNMSSTLSEQANNDDTNSMWNTSNKTVKANANTSIDAYHDKTSAKDRRKQRQELEKQRRELERQQQQHEEKNTKAGVSAMVLPTVKGKDMDVNLPNITLSLDNGTSLLEQGDLKFAYRRRYAIIGENGVGKTTLLNRIANWQDLEGFPQHLRVLHVKQELGVPDSTTVLEAVLEADVERTTLLKEEKELTARLEGNGLSVEEMTIEARQKQIAEKSSDQFSEDMKKLKDIYDRLTLLGADNAQSRAAAILSGLQFTEEMQNSPIKSLSGGWRMRVALAAALLITPDLLMLDERTWTRISKSGGCVVLSCTLILTLYVTYFGTAATNHLDLEAVLWLEAHLQQYPHTVIIVSHDRGFLNEVCTDTIEFKNKKLTCTFSIDIEETIMNACPFQHGFLSFFNSLVFSL